MGPVCAPGKTDRGDLRETELMCSMQAEFFYITVNQITELSVGAQDWKRAANEPEGTKAALSANAELSGLESCPNRRGDGMSFLGTILFGYFLCHARGLSVQLDSSLGILVAGQFHARLSGERSHS